MNKGYINIPNTRDWVKCNEDNHAPRWRQLFVEQNGGEFISNGRYWQWHEKATIKEEKNDKVMESFVETKLKQLNITVSSRIRESIIHTAVFSSFLLNYYLM